MKTPRSFSCSDTLIVLSCREIIGGSNMIFEVPCLVDRNMARV